MQDEQIAAVAVEYSAELEWDAHWSMSEDLEDQASQTQDEQIAAVAAE